MTDVPELVLTLYPSPILRKVAEPVAAFDDELKTTVEGMYKRMVASKGVGLAAPQIGLGKRILILNPTGEEGDDLTLINPKITARTGDKVSMEEGCLSFPGIYGMVQRPDRCTVEAQNVDGELLTADYEGFISRIIQHEFDHLEGILLIDRVSPTDKLKNKAGFEELVDNYKAARARTRG
ncbi:MAG: peptide deformylase [Planctomycetota bacterium]|jgi:peptide deformylase